MDNGKLIRFVHVTTGSSTFSSGAGKPGKKISFTGGFLALALHVFLAAALGVAISQFFSIRALCFSTAAVFGCAYVCC